MSKSIIINSAKIPKDGGISAHTRNAIIIANELGLPLISTAQETKGLNAADFQNFVIVGSAFYEQTAHIEKWIRQNHSAKIIWINNEYSTTPNSEYYRMMKDFKSVVISNVGPESTKCKYYDEFYLLDLNSLIWRNPNKTIFKKYDWIYYGTYRPGRRLYFQKYFGENIHISSSVKNLKRIHQLSGVDATWIKALNWQEGIETLNLFKYSLYIEDEYTHTHYNHLANRFYESLTCNVVQFFDVNCQNTLEQSGLNHQDNYFISSKEEIMSIAQAKNYEQLQKEQYAWNQYAEMQRNKVLFELQKILC
jgi:hypothetical protein